MLAATESSPRQTVVRKRNGTTVQPFNSTKIEKAIRAAWEDAEGKNSVDESVLSKILTMVTGSLVAEVADVEQIQDAVEVSLMKYKKYAVAKSYILYRNKRAEARAVRGKPDEKAIADYIHYGKYARYVPELGRREVFKETVDRDRKMHLDRFADKPEVCKLINEAFEFVYEKKLLPSMRSFQFAGPAIEKNHARQYNCSYTLIDRPRAFAEALFLLLCGCGVGYSVQFEHVEKLPKLTFINEKNVVHHIVEDTIEGWADAAHALFMSYVHGHYLELGYHLIRPAGTPLKTSGGRAPGHMKLKESLERVRSVLNGAQGRKLRPIEAHRIVVLLADAVLSGGIRRSACIALFSPDDSEMAYAKTGNWFEKDPWFANANNSVALNRNEVTEKKFKRIFELTKEFGEPGFVFVNDNNFGTNPCQPRWATVLTPGGIRTFDDIEIGSTIWSGKRWTKVINKVATGVKPVYEFHTRAGSFVGTENHRVVSGGLKVEAGSAEAIDIATGGAEGGAFDAKSIMDGLIIGDGSVHRASNNLVHLCVGKDDGDYLNSEISGLMLIHRPGLHNYAWEVSTTVSHEELPATYEREIPDRFRFGNEKTVRSFLRGLYTANGSVISGANRVTLKASSLKIIKQAQEMLSSIGIQSYYTTNKTKSVKFSNGDYQCKESYDLNITAGIAKFEKLVGFIQKYKTAKLAQSVAAKNGKTSFEVVSRTLLGEENVYDITVDDEEHTYWTGGLLVSNCGEIGLDPVLKMNSDTRPLFEKKLGRTADSIRDGEAFSGYAFCNLCEINAAKLTSPDDLLAVTRAAAIIGTLQASYTSFPYLGWKSELIAEREALLGISMTGMMDRPDISCNPEYQRAAAAVAIETNKEVAALLGIRESARITAVKPAGSSSLELGGVASGIHPHHAKRYIRRVTADEYEVVFQEFKRLNPKLCLLKPDGKWVIEFPVEAPEGATVKEDLSAIEFLEIVKGTQQAWVIPGTARPDSSPGLTHNVSNTVSVRPEEWDAVADYIWANREFFTGISLLPMRGDKEYSFSPMEAVVTEADEARWNYLVANYTPVDYTKVMEAGDSTDLAGELACFGGACLV